MTFLEYLQKIFYPFLCEQGIEFPVVLFIDGRTLHFSFETSEFCAEKQIVLIALYPNSTNLLHPMDVAVFGPLRKSWRAAVNTWKFKNSHFKSLTKEHFGKLLQQVIAEKVKPEYLQSGFRTSGLFPFGSDGINFEKLMGNNSIQDAAEEIETGTDERVRTEAASALKFIEQVLGAEKVCAFLDFYLTDSTRSWNACNEDTTAYYIWKEALVRSQNFDEEEIDVGDHELISNEIMDEEMFDWDRPTDVEYFASLENIKQEE